MLLRINFIRDKVKKFILEKIESVQINGFLKSLSFFTLSPKNRSLKNIMIPRILVKIITGGHFKELMPVLRSNAGSTDL
jgi:hypothetical protein